MPYNYNVNEIVSDLHPNLELDIDPKTAWAIRNPSFFPINVNKANREQLLRIPGIGVRTVDKILKIRRYTKIKLQDLIQLRVAWKRAKAFTITADYHPTKQTENEVKLILNPAPKQLSLVLNT